MEDSFNGARAAEAAGLRTYLVPEWAAPTPDLTAQCAAVLDSLRELPALVLAER